jgi:1,4-alpha-glucan branching enzyme
MINVQQKHKVEITDQDLLSLIHSEHHNPHSILGIHPHSLEERIIRIWRPDAEQISIEINGKIVGMTRVHPAGLFEAVVPQHVGSNDYRVYHQNGLLSYDPYAFPPTIGELDQYLFSRGVHYQLYKVMGAHLASIEGKSGVRFAVWAPSAKRVSIVGDFNHWDGRANPMRTMGYSGIWEIFIPGIKQGDKYKYEIKTQKGEILIKSDPFAFSSQLRPATASIVADIDHFPWSDQEWINKRMQSTGKSNPLLIYELHLGSWRKRGDQFLNYREIAPQLADYCLEMGFTHVELLPIMEHPLDESWGYQVSGYYAVTSRYGSPEEFQYFVNYLHTKNIGVILDWVPGHFPTDDFSLGRFDGTALYEHEDPRQGMHPHWFTHIFNFGRHEVVNFLIANALFWLEVMHVDGLRVDAVASMIYLDYGRNAGEWIPNRYGGNENLEAIEFFKHVNSVVHKNHPGVLMIAEESSAFTGITHSLENGGLGFDFKWNMGWMNDTLRYFSKDMIFRHYHHNDLTFGLLYAFSEKFILVFSHDEVVHGKKHLISKMPGDLWQKFANLRLIYSYMICHPGKKLLFMGGELAQWDEWWCKKELDWFLLNFPNHKGIQNLVQDMNHFYLKHGALWEKDFDHTCFEWIDFSDTQNSVISYLRKGFNSRLFCVHNFTPNFNTSYLIHLRNVSHIHELFNSDAEKYGGSNKLNSNIEIVRNESGPIGIRIVLAPLATMIFHVDFI